MANTFTSVYIHLVFAVKNRTAIIPPPWQTRIWAYIARSIEAHGHTPIAVGGTHDHIHILMKYKITELIPDLVRDIKTGTAKFISENKVSLGRFSWQTGYGCFSYGASQVEDVKNYINNQAMHHRGRSLRDEIKSYLDRCGIEFDEKYLFEEV
ncbi:MAG: IS200/IS605 family transposase [Paramuribaculum sp.]|nr:IS200/IS605 family transposase [Paramuribaculum sp.]